MGDVELGRRVASRADAAQSQESYSAAINMIQHPLPQASPNPRQRLAASREEKQLKSSVPRAVTHPPTQLPSSLGSLKGPAERVLSCLPPAQAAAGGVPAPATLLHPVPTTTYSFCGTLLLPPKQNTPGNTGFAKRMPRHPQLPSSRCQEQKCPPFFFNFIYFLTIKLHHCLHKP